MSRECVVSRLKKMSRLAALAYKKVCNTIMKVELLAEAWDTQMTTKNSKSNYFVLDLYNSFSDEKCLTVFYIRRNIYFIIVQ